MRIMILGAVIAVVIGCAIGFYNTRSKPTASQTGQGIGQETTVPEAEKTSKVAIRPPASTTSQAPVSQKTAQVVRTAAAPVAPVAQPQINFSDAVDRLLSPESTFAQRQEAWGYLSKSGELDAAIKEFEKSVAENPESSQSFGALGQAYLIKAGTITDLREQGILAMQADKILDSALEKDASNWDARYIKAVAMTYWPPQLGKGPEVIGHFTQLIDQQEAQAAQPHFAQTYAKLGEQYEKQGQADAAREAWERGAALFPNDETLRKKLAQPVPTANPNPTAAPQAQ